MATELTFLDYKWADGTLSSRGVPIRLPYKETLVLGELLSQPNRIVTSARLIEAAWPGQVGCQQSLNRAIAGLRARLPELGTHLVTHHRQGYCLELPVAGPTGGQAPSAAPDAFGSAMRMLGLQAPECCAATLHALRQILVTDPNNLDVLQAIADVELTRVQLGHTAPRSGAAAAASAARRVLAVNPEAGGALSLVGWTEVVVNDRTDGLAMLETAVKRAPDNPATHARYGWALRHAGQNDAAVKEDRRLEETAPRSNTTLHAIYAFNRLLAGDLDTARDSCQSSLVLSPYEHRNLLVGAIIESRLDDHEAALDYGRRLLEVRSRNLAHVNALMAWLMHRGGYVSEAEALLQTVLEDRSHLRPSTFLVPALVLIRGEAAGLDMQDQARGAGCPNRRWLLDVTELGWLADAV